MANVAGKPGDPTPPNPKPTGRKPKKRTWRDFRIRSNPFDFRRQSSSFILTIGAFFSVVLAIYLTCHLIFPPTAATYGALQYVDINAYGQVTIKSAEDIEWFVGSKKAVPLLEAMKQRNQQIQEARTRVIALFGEVAPRVSPEVAEDLRNVVSAFQKGQRVEPIEPPEDSSGPYAKFFVWLKSLVRDFGEECECREESDSCRESESETESESCKAAERQASDCCETSKKKNSGERPLSDSENREELLRTLQAVREQLTNQVLGIELMRERYEALASIITNEMSHVGTGLESALQAVDNEKFRRARRLKNTLATNLSDSLKNLNAAQKVLTNEFELSSIGAGDQAIGDLKRHIARLDEIYTVPTSACLQFGILTRRLSAADNEAIGSALLHDVETHLQRLDALREEQLQTLRSLRRPEKYSVFWTTPAGCLWEVVFWSIFGALTSVLVKASETRWQNQFRPGQRFTSYVKIAYAPMVAVAVALALINGLVSILGEETRVWTMPLLAFLAGYNARKTASLIDRLGQKVLGSAFESMDKSREERLAMTVAAEAAIQKALPLTSLDELEPRAKEQASRVLYRIVAKLDRNR